MNAKKTILVLSLALLALVLASCGEKAECQQHSDCPSVGECSRGICTPEGMCSYDPIKNCCGNNLCEGGENVCTCSDDCSTDQTESGKCQGKVLLPDPYYKDKMTEADYAMFACVDNECIVSVDSRDIQSGSFVTNTQGFIKFQLITSMNNPFVLGVDQLKLKLSITDNDESYAQLPVTITGVQVLSGNELLGDYSTRHTINAVGTSVEMTIPLSATLSSLEEAKYIHAIISYEYNKVDLYDESVSVDRKTFSSADERITFIDPRKA